MKRFLERNGGKELSEQFTPDIQPLEDIYLTSGIEFDFQLKGNAIYLKILLVAGIGILLMAIINFINITSAQNLRRLKQIGLKKILGSKRIYLVMQLLIESVLLSILSLIVVCSLILVLLPYFNSLTGKSFTPLTLFDLNTSLLLICITLLVGVISGIYPALVATSLPPINILSSRIKGTLTTGRVRKYLVVVQFVAAILLLVSTGVVYQQVNYMHEKELGFNKDQVIIMQDARIIASNPPKVELFRNEITKYKQIQTVSASSSSPGQHTWRASYTLEGFESDQKISVSTIYADEDFVKTYDLTLAKGRDFDKRIASDSSAFLINEAAVRFFSTMDTSWFVNPVNKKIHNFGIEGNIIGVVKDFHLESLAKEIAPLIIQIQPKNFFNIQMKINTNELSSSLELLKITWVKLFPDIPFTYVFVDQEFAKLFESEQKLKSILNVFTIISLLIPISFDYLERLK